MSQLDLEGSLRRVLREQLRELVKRCAPETESVHREAITGLLEEMINAWVNADKAMRPTVLKIWLEKIGARVAVAKTIKGVKAGRILVPASQAPPRSSGKIAIHHHPKGNETSEDPAFDLLQPKSGGRSRERATSVESTSAKIAELLHISASDVEHLRQKLRSNGLDIALLKADAALRMNPDRRPGGAKSRHD